MHDAGMNVGKIEVMEHIHEENEKIADQVNEKLTEKGIFVINVMGTPGAGKTTTIRNIIANTPEIKPYIIEGDIESDLDTKLFQELGVEAIQINTGGACHLDAPLIEHAVEHLPLDKKGLLFIENIGNLVCPAEFMIGEHIKLLIVTVTDGSDKPYKYPLAFEKADIIILNKSDLIPYVNFDEDFFMKGVRGLNKEVPVFKVSGTTGEGHEAVSKWITERVKEL